MTVTKCPKCGQPASGHYCSSCAAPLTSAACPSCGGALSAGAQFCHLCGSPTSVAAARPQTPLWPWIVGILTASLLFAAIGFFAGRVNAPPPAPNGPTAGAPSTGVTDLTTMSPREQADRLFDRVMREHEAGNAEQVTFFAPMTIQAYEILGPLDADARYHVGLIQAITGGQDAALAQADSLEQDVAGHLFASMLRAGVYQALNQDAEVNRTYEAFLASYDAEMAQGRQEYEMHGRAIASFLEEARAAVGNSTR